MTDQHLEIERKFLVKSLPDLSNARKTYIRQGYLTDPDDSIEIRLRQKNELYIITVKSGTGMVRTERETQIDQQQFETLWPDTLGKRIEKHRFIGDLGHQQTYELDVFIGELAPLMLVEVEFTSLEQADDFEPAEWFGREVTVDKCYKNKALAMHQDNITIC